MKKFEGSAVDWNKLIADFSSTHILQTWEWSLFKAEYGWEPFAFTWGTPASNDTTPGKPKAAAMILKRRIPIRGFSSRLSVLYAPRGPLLNWSDQDLVSEVLNDLQDFAKKQGSIFLKIDPGIEIDIESKPGINIQDKLSERGWNFSQDQVQFRNTAVIILDEDEDQILANCKQKTRYNIRLAGRKGITVRQGSLDDLDMLYGLYAETSIRDGFVIREKNYYLTLWKKFMRNTPGKDNPGAIPLIAEINGNPIAAILIFFFSDYAYYLYGMSSDLHREKMPNHLLQWEAIKLSKSLGCKVYDLWGAPDEITKSDPMWGVYRFKKGLGASLVQTPGAWDFPARSTIYKYYTQIIPKVLDLMRRRGKSQTRRSISLNE